MNLTWTRRLLFVIAQAAALPAAMEAVAAEIAVDLPAPVPKYVGVYTRPPNTVGSLDPSIHAYRIPDGPLMGNGDIAVAVGGTATEQTFYLSKSDLSHSARGVGGLTISFKDATANDMPAEGSKYRQEQDLYKAEVRSVIPLRQATVKMRSWTADGDNVLVTEIWTEPAAPVEISLRLWSHTDRSRSQAGAENGVIWSTREMNATIGTTKQPFVSKVAVATRIMGIKPECSTNGKDSSLARFALPEGKTVQIITVVAGGHNAVKHVEKAKEFAAALTAQKIDDLHAAHREWWKTYWSKSSIAINDEELEKFYYGALYVLGCSSREGSIPPGLAGPWHLHGPICWSNKYTLDYNFEAQWWGVYSSNRAELAMPYYDVILKLIPEGQRLARENGTRGVLFGVNAHAWGGFTDTRTLNMKGNAALAALNFMNHYNYTQDEKFLVDKNWPLLKELVLFWEDNLVWDEANSRWIVLNSGAREGQRDNNAINDLGHLTTLFRFLLRTSDVLEGKISGGETIHITNAQKKKWQSYIDHMSEFPTTKFNGKTVFMEAENRNRMSLGGPGDNSDVLMHVFPSEAISLGSDPNLLVIARNTVSALNPDDKKASWFQANCFPKIYTQAVRSGYPADKVMANLKRLLSGEQPYDDRGDHVRLRDNLTIVPPMHGLENVGAIEAINSMLLQSHDDVLRLFPVWIAGRDASFKNLRAYGAFLVSSEYRNGRVAYIDITSEAGRRCTIENPWPGKACKIVLTTEPRTAINCTIIGNLIRFSTERNRQYEVLPQ
jgi:hypothetical protein